MIDLTMTQNIKTEVSFLHAIASTLPQPQCKKLHESADRIWEEAKRAEHKMIFGEAA